MNNIVMTTRFCNLLITVDVEARDGHDGMNTARGARSTESGAHRVTWRTTCMTSTAAQDGRHSPSSSKGAWAREWREQGTRAMRTGHESDANGARERMQAHGREGGATKARRWRNDKATARAMREERGWRETGMRRCEDRTRARQGRQRQRGRRDRGARAGDAREQCNGATGVTRGATCGQGARHGGEGGRGARRGRRARHGARHGGEGRDGATRREGGARAGDARERHDGAMGRRGNAGDAGQCRQRGVQHGGEGRDGARQGEGGARA
ncbi:hypothetical protein DENSPDRAFT_851419 [Dentipellis sp. KUC8613]|nr:hypothetical protein DENSPDRAFT_851419 [Dentipellis sp. KUC8613]